MFHFCLIQFYGRGKKYLWHGSCQSWGPLWGTLQGCCSSSSWLLLPWIVSCTPYYHSSLNIQGAHNKLLSKNNGRMKGFSLSEWLSVLLASGGGARWTRTATWKSAPTPPPVMKSVHFPLKATTRIFLAILELVQGWTGCICGHVIHSQKSSIGHIFTAAMFDSKKQSLFHQAHKAR